MEPMRNITRTYPLSSDVSAQNVAYALAEFLDLQKNMITQTMRIRNGYTIQCKGDAAAEWTKYLGMNATVSVELVQSDNQLVVTIDFDKWMEKLGIAAVGAVIFRPLLITSAIGALRQTALPQDIFAFIEDYLNVEPIEADDFYTRNMMGSMETSIACPHCGTLNRSGALFCKKCGEDLVPKVSYCKKCNAQLDGDEDFCPYCGTKVSEEVEE